MNKVIINILTLILGILMSLIQRHFGSDKKLSDRTNMELEKFNQAIDLLNKLNKIEEKCTKINKDIVI